MKRTTVVILVILIVIAFVLIIREFTGLQTQVLQTPVVPEEVTDISDCLKLSEDVANSCIMCLAIENGDASICDEITKRTVMQDCVREVELAY